MSRAMLVLDTEFQRRKAADWCWTLKHGTRVEFKAPRRTDDQNAKMWVMLSEIATQTKHHGIKLTPDDWKLLFLDALKREVRMVPNLDGNGIVSLGRSSSDLSKEEMSDLIELIHEFGARNGVTFHNPHEPSSPHHPAPEDAAAGVSPAPAATDPEPASGGPVEGGDNPGTAAPPSEPDMVNSARPMNTDGLKAEMVKKLLQLAGDKALSAQERLENLDSIKPAWIDRMPGFPVVVDQCFATAAKIVKGELKPDAARKFMEGLTT